LALLSLGLVRRSSQDIREDTAPAPRGKRRRGAFVDR
jgi:hypothetical protein